MREIGGAGHASCSRIASNAARHIFNVRWRTESMVRSAYLDVCIKRPADEAFA
ncbi:hypothetical protein [Metallibacterium sp.]